MNAIARRAPVWGSAIDICVLGLLVAALFLFNYHPTFFGDELFGPQLHLNHGKAFWPAYREWNEYKPRLLLAALLAGLAWLEVPRWIHALTGALLAFSLCGIVYAYVRVELKEGRALGLAAGAAVVTSRLGSMFPFDYVAAILELLALLLFLGSCWVLQRAVGASDPPEARRRALLGLMIGVCCVFVHERFAAPVFIVLFAAAHAQSSRAPGTRTLANRAVHSFAVPLLAGMLPVALYVLAQSLISTSPLLTGTAGLGVSFGSDNVDAFFIYLSNVLFGTTLGNDWHWGSAHLQSPLGQALAVFAATGSMVALTGALFFGATKSRGRRWQAVVLFVAAIALLLVATLPGTARQEARWGFPAYALLTIATCIAFRSYWRWCVLILSVITSSAHWAFGAHGQIYNVYGSRTADTFVRNTPCVDGASGQVLLVGPKPEEAWIFMGWNSMAGEAFSSLNFGGRVQVDYLPRPGAHPSPYAYSAGVRWVSHPAAVFECMPYQTLLADLGGAALEVLTVDEVLATTGQWGRIVHDRGAGGPSGVFDSSITGWILVPAPTLNDRLLIYTVRAMGDGPGNFKLQINWHDGADRFLTADIKPISVPAERSLHGLFVRAPEGAAWGRVYFGGEGTQGPIEVLDVELRSARPSN